jgi:outer membrane protein TolC
LRLSNANLQAGTMLLTDVLQAQEEADSGRLRYVEAVARYDQSQVNLLAALGLMQAPAAIQPTTAPSPPQP